MTIDEQIETWIADFVSKQQPLGEPFATILQENFWELISESDPVYSADSKS